MRVDLRVNSRVELSLCFIFLRLMVCDKTEGELLSGLHNISSFIDPILPMNYTLIEAAQWPNQLNDGGYWILQNASHFDLPFSPDGITVPIDVQDWDFNLAYALGEFDYDLYKLIKASTSWNDTLTFEASFDLRYVISLFGIQFFPESFSFQLIFK